MFIGTRLLLSAYPAFCCWRKTRKSGRRAGATTLPCEFIRPNASFGSGFSPALAIVPIAQQPMRQRSQQEMNCDARDRNQEQGGEHSRNIEAKARLDNAIRQPRPLAG